MTHPDGKVSAFRRRAAGFAALAAVLLGGWWSVRHYRERLHAKVTTERISVLSTILQVERPPTVTPAVLRQLTAKYRRPDVLVDAWGRQHAVVLEEGRYVVSSAGRDGVFGGCCVRAQEATPDTDLIAVDGEWKQVWH